MFFVVVVYISVNIILVTGNRIKIKTNNKETNIVFSFPNSIIMSMRKLQKQNSNRCASHICQSKHRHRKNGNPNSNHLIVLLFGVFPIFSLFFLMYLQCEKPLWPLKDKKQTTKKNKKSIYISKFYHYIYIVPNIVLSKENNCSKWSIFSQTNQKCCYFGGHRFVGMIFQRGQRLSPGHLMGNFPLDAPS